MKKDIEVNLSLGEETYDPCDGCGTHTYHIRLASADSVRYGKNDMVMLRHSYQVVQCQGCKKLSFKKQVTNSFAIPNPEVTIQFFPSRLPYRYPLSRTLQFPAQVGAVYEEAHRALADGSVVLAGMGIRAIIEAICKDKNAQGSNLHAKIDSLVKMSILTPDGAKVLHALRVMGNEAAHSVKAHSIRELEAAFEVIDFLFRSAYVLPLKAKELGL